MTENFPKSELYGLTAQMRGAAGSIPSNIAEGHGRRTSRQRYKFLEDSLGSAYELETWLELARRLHFVDNQSAEGLADELKRVGRGLTGLMAYVAKEARSQPRRRRDTSPKEA